MPKVEDVTHEALAELNHAPGETAARINKAKAAKTLTPTLQQTLDEWNRRYDKTLPYVSKVLAYGFRFPKASWHANIARLVKGGHLKLCRVDAKPPEGSEAKRQSPYGERYYIMRSESCPSEVPEGTLAGTRRR